MAIIYWILLKKMKGRWCHRLPFVAFIITLVYAPISALMNESENNVQVYNIGVAAGLYIVAIVTVNYMNDLTGKLKLVLLRPLLAILIVCVLAAINAGITG